MRIHERVKLSRIFSQVDTIESESYCRTVILNAVVHLQEITLESNSQEFYFRTYSNNDVKRILNMYIFPYFRF